LIVLEAGTECKTIMACVQAERVVGVNVVFCCR